MQNYPNLMPVTYYATNENSFKEMVHANNENLLNLLALRSKSDQIPLAKIWVIIHNNAL